jgi:hypothetical protein
MRSFISLGRFVGESDGQDRIGGYALGDQIRHATRDDARLSAARASHDQQRAVHVRGRLALRVGQVLQQLINVRHAGLSGLRFNLTGTIAVRWPHSIDSQCRNFLAKLLDYR